MPYEVRFADAPAGYALEAPDPASSTVKIATRDFTSSEDGELFISRVEGLPNQVLAMLPASAGCRPESLNNLLAVIRRDLTTTVYVNECGMQLRVRAAR